MRESDLEKALRRLLPLKHFVLTGYARNGLYLLIKAMGWDSDDEIIIPAFTCPIVHSTITASGVHPVMVDSEPDGLNIDPSEVAKAITPSTRAVYVVHTYGSVARIEEICAIAGKHGILVIEDLAHSLFYNLHGQQLGTFGDFAVLSFTKKIINFEGGAIGTNHTDVYEKMLVLQLELQKDRPVSFNDLRDYYVRLTGSWWESRFTFPSLLFMKIHDIINDLLFKGGYGLSVDSSKFFSNRHAMRLTLWQLDRLARNNTNTSRYLKFRDRFHDNIGIAEIHQSTHDTLPAYYSGTLGKNVFLMKILSFRTWHNFVAGSRFPRAQYLYATYRIFTRSILLLPRAGRKKSSGRNDTDGFAVTE